MKKDDDTEEEDDGASGEVDSAADAGEKVSERSDGGMEKENEESEEFSFPDTTITLSHLQPSR